MTKKCGGYGDDLSLEDRMVATRCLIWADAHKNAIGDQLSRDEQIRVAALTAAIKAWKRMRKIHMEEGYTPLPLGEYITAYEKYIRTGKQE